MPLSVNGTGTRFYGNRTDDKYGTVTTQWFTIYFVPLIPIRSMRISYAGSSVGLLSSSTHYQVLEKLPLQWGQVVRVYGFLAACILWFGLVTGCVYKFGGDSPSIPFLTIAFAGFLPAPFWVLYFIRRNQ